MAGVKNPKYKGIFKQCIKCDNKRYSKHRNCLYCIKCRDIKNNEHLKKAILQWKRNNKEHLAEYRRLKYPDWKENRNKKNKEETKQLSDTYIRNMISSRSILKPSEVPDTLIKLKRLDIQLKRERDKYRGKSK